MRYLARLRAACVLAAASLLPFLADAQTAPAPAKALVYCPAAIDAVGCTNIAAALTAGFPGGVDRGYDGSDGTVDLRSADLWSYEVFVVPSLADGAGTTPYALLRDGVVAERLRDALMGRVAMWSGTPDLGSLSSPNRDQKNTLILNLARWAGGNYGVVKGPGLVTFLDQSETATERYDWARTITGLNVIADLKIASYSAVSAVTPTATSILASGDALLAYANMASFGFQLPSGAAGVSLDAIGSTGTTVGGQVVLLTAPGGNTAGATVRTDLDDYPPGTTVVMTGSGWQPGETVTLTLHEDPISHSDRTFSTIADASGNIEFTGFAPEAHDIDVRFILTATGASSGFRAQTTFTDGIAFGGSTTSDNAGGGTSLAVGVPAGTVAGDVMLAQVTVSGGSNVTLTPPAGWNFIVRNNSSTLIGQAIYWRIASAAEPASYAWGFNIPSKAAGGIVRYSGANVSDLNPIAAFHGENGNGSGGATTSLVAPSVTTSVPSTMVVTFYAMRANTNLSTPTLMTERHQRTSSSPLAPAGPTIMASEVERFEAGATGEYTSVGNASASWVAQTVALDWRQTGTGGTANPILVVGRPLEATAGDLLLANIMFRGGTNTIVKQVPAGWNLIAKRTNTGTPITQATYWRVADAAEPANYSWTLPDGVRAVGAITAYSNIDRENPIDAVATSLAVDGVMDSSTTPTAPSVTTTSHGAVVVAAYALERNTTFKAPAGMLTRYDTNSASITKVAGADVLQPDAGASGPKVATLGTKARYVAQTIALRRPVPTKLVFVTPERFGFVDECLGPITIQGRDNSNRSAIVDGNTPVALATSGSGGFFTGAGCATSTGTSVTIAAGTNAATVYYKATARGSGAHQLTATASGLAGASQDQTIDEDPAAPTMAGTLVRTTATSQFSPPSPDPSGIAYASHLGHLVMVDGEVDEMAIYGGANAFETTPSGSLARSWASTSFSTEVVGAAYNPANRHLFIADDVKKRVFEIDPGPDEQYSTADDQVSSFDTRAFGSDDPEGLAFDGVQGTLFIADGGNAQVYRVSPGANGVFDGVAPAGDDQVSSFDTEAHGLLDPEGIAYAPDVQRLYVVGRPRTRVFEFSTAGAVLNVIDISAAITRNPAGLEYVPASSSSTARTLYIVDRGVDNLTDPTENDGRMYEFSLPSAAGNYPPAVTIAAPASGSTYNQGDAITFTGTASDVEDGNLAGSLTWSSSRDGAIGSGGSLSTSGLSAGTHTITATVTDRRGATASATVQVTVNVVIIPTAVGNVTASASTFGGTTDLAATVSPAAAGSVIFLIDGRAASIAATYDPATGIATASGVAHDLSARSSAYGVRAIFTSANQQYTGSEAVNASALQVSQASQTIAFDLSGISAKYGDAPIALASLASGGASGNPVTFASNTPATCEVTSATQLRLAAAGACSVTASQAGTSNHADAASVAQTFVIATRTLTVTATGVDKIYDGTAVATVSLADDRLAGDDLSVTYTTAAFDDANVGSAKPVTIAGIALAGAAAGNYTMQLAPGVSASITALPLASSIIADDKVYDGTTAAVARPQPLAGTVAGDAITLVVENARFDSRNVGARVVTADLALAGAGAGNYVLQNATATASANISPKALVGSFTATSKTYDRTAAATIEATSLLGVVTPDEVVLEPTAVSFSDEMAGTAKQVTASLRITGAEVGNYTVNPTATTTADILPRALAVSATGVDKTYDGTTAAAVALADNRLGGDAFALGFSSASFADANVGTAKPIAIEGIVLTGPDASNYTPNATAGGSADITALTITGSIVAEDKTYDGTTTAVATPQPLAGLLAGDAVVLVVSNARFDSRHVGTRTVAADISLGGAAARNYALATSSANASASITAKALTGSFSAASKIYDRTVDATVSATSLPGVVGQDVVTLQAVNAAFDSRTVGAARPVTASLALVGADAPNYTVNATAVSAADITPRPLVVSATGVGRMYDGTVLAEVVLADDRISGDVFDARYSAASFADANMGADKPIAVSGISIDGSDAGNYAVNPTASTTASIAARQIAVVADAATKVYGDADPAFTYRVASGSLVAGESFTGALGRVAGESVAGSPYAIGQGTLSAGSNYALGFTGASLAISRRPVTARITAADKVYDGGTAATIVASIDGSIAEDDVEAVAGPATFADKHAGNGKLVSASGIALTGPDADNYSLASTTATTTVAITPRQLVVSAAGQDKVYDGTTAAAATLSDDRLAGDMLTVNHSGATFADANAGSGKAVAVAGISITGADAANYTANSTATTVATIAARPVMVRADALSKVYGDADPILTYQVVSGSLVAGETLSGTLARAAGETVAGSPYAITRGSLTAGANYDLGFTGADLGITRRPVTVKILASDRIYDGTTAATVVATLDGAGVGDAVEVVIGAAAFADANAGNDKQVTATGIELGGNGGDNYVLASTTAVTTADITPRQLVVSATGQDRVYDGTRAATVTLSDDRLAGDALTIDHGGATFADASAGLDKAVAVTGISVAGADAGNYLANTTAATVASITPRAVVVRANPATKVYGDADPTFTYELVGGTLVGGDAFAGALTRTPGETVVGAPYAITQGSLSAGANYVLGFTGAALSIRQRPVTATIVASDKVYDGTTTASVVGALDGARPGDQITVVVGAASFADANVGTDKQVTATGLGTSGADAGNYALASSAAVTTADITPRVLTLSATGQDKEYDGTTAATATLSDDRLAGDAIATSYTAAAFADANAGSGKAIAISGISLTGAGAANYTFNATAAATGSITRRPVTAQIAAGDKVYDGTVAATIATILNGAIGGDDVEAVAGSATFADKHAGIDKQVTATGITLGGSDAANYLLASGTASAVADITPRPLAISVTASSKVYDGTTAATVTLSDDRLSGDALSTSYASASFADANAGSAKLVTVSGIAMAGADAGNYTVSPTAQATADITPASATITLGNLSHKWDGAVKSATATTSPASLGVTFTYSQNGIPVAAPKNAGFYDVVAMISSPNYQGTATGTLVILNLVDITPGNTLNIISLRDTKTTEILAAVLGTATFDARTVVAASATLGDGIGADAPVNTTSAGAIRSAYADVNADGRADLVLYFQKATVISAGSVTTQTKELILRATLTSGAAIRGSDKVAVYP